MLMRAADPVAAATEVLSAGRTGVVEREPPWVKICGVNSRESVLAVAEAGADAAGFVFAESPRRVTPRKAAELAELLPPGVSRVAVFRHPTPQEVSEVLSEFQADLVQCEPSPEVWIVAREAGIRLLPVLHDGPDLERQASSLPEEGAAPAAILEGPGKGGRGIRPDWDRAAAVARRLPLVLAGGLAPDNVAEAIAAVRPYGVDVSSGVEEARGRKDPVRIAAFVEAARTGGKRGDRRQDLGNEPGRTDD
jgi:phosphoribosylanthranilate isomerase